MAREQIQVTSFDHQELKQSLIDYLKSTGEFDDFDFEGSALNTIVDLLVRNTHYDSFLANMLAGESFIDSAQIRGNVVSHARKLSYVPRSCTASRAVVNVTVTPSTTTNLPSSIDIPIGTPFLATVNGQSYQFITNDVHTLVLSNNQYLGQDIVLYQGQRIENSAVHVYGTEVIIPNELVDVSTLKVSTTENGDIFNFTPAQSISEVTGDQNFYFLSENYNRLYVVEFGRDIIGREPENNSVVNLSYINTERTHANGASTFIAASTIGGFANINVEVTTPAYGGSDRETIEDIRFLAPKAYQAQDRAVVSSDYTMLLKRQFPFIRSLKTWGGEDNDPPQYGKVFISIITNEDETLTRAIKQDIVTYLKDYNIGSVTPEVVDPDIVRLKLLVSFAVDVNKATKTFAQLSQELDSIIQSYSSDALESFNNYYNDSRLVDQLMSVRGVESCDIDKVAIKSLRVLRFNDPTYSYNFNNPIVPGSLFINNINADANAQEQFIEDDGEGVIVYVKTVSGQTTKTDIGTIDYDSGDLTFTLNMIQDDLTFDVQVTPIEENFYVYNNKYLSIENTEYQQLTLFPNKSF